MRERNSAALRGKNPFTNRPHPRGMAGKPAWNRGLTWAEMYSTEVAKRQREQASTLTRIAHQAMRNSPEREQARRAKLSQVALRRGLGGYERGSGRGKKGWYRGHWCDSTYEGYVTPQALAKFEFFYRPLRILTQTDMRPMFEYVWVRYGKNLPALYE
jgi:hypothetical protein